MSDVKMKKPHSKANAAKASAYLEIHGRKPLTDGLPGVRLQKSAYRADTRTLRRDTVQRLWLEGNRPGEIALELEVSIATINSDIIAIRKSLYEESEANLQEHSEQSVAILRRMLPKLWHEYETCATSSMRIKALEQVRKTEEVIAKIRGVLSDKVIADVVHHHKLYDIDVSKMPKPIIEGALVEGQATEIASAEDDTISEGHFTDIPKTTDLPESAPDLQEQLERPEYDEDELTDVVALPNGDLVSLKPTALLD